MIRELRGMEDDNATAGEELVVYTHDACVRGRVSEFTPVLRPLPTVALAAILISAGIHLIEVREYRMLLRIHRRAAFVAFMVGFGVLIVGMIPGILIGVGLSLIYVLARLARPYDAVLHEVPGTGSFHDVGDTPVSHTIPGLIAYCFYAPLFFANAEHFIQRIQNLLPRAPNRSSGS